MTTNKRIEYIDALRGLTMTLVVYQHINTYMGGKAILNTAIGEALLAIRMPLFFFISGFIAYKTLEWTPKLFTQLLFKKAKIQLIPTMVFSLIYTTAFLDKTEIYTSSYWFTIVLFIFFFLFYTISLISKEQVLLKNTLLVTLALAGIACTPLDIGAIWSFYNELCIWKVFKYFNYFVIGILARQYYPTLQKLVNNSYTNAASIVIFVVSMLFLRTTDIFFFSTFKVFIREVIVPYSGLFIVFSLFYRHQDYFATNGKISSAMQYIGRYTLDIYMLHYFFIDLNGRIAGKIHDINYLPLEIFANITLALMNIALCLLLSQCIRNSKFLAKYLFGAKQN